MSNSVMVSILRYIQAEDEDKHEENWQQVFNLFVQRKQTALSWSLSKYFWCIEEDVGWYNW